MILSARLSLLAAFALCSLNCRHGQVVGAAAAGSAHLPAAEAEHLQLATCSQAPITLGGLSADAHRALTRLDDTYALRRYAFLWVGVEDVIAQRLLSQEASRRSMSMGALLEQEVDHRVGAPSVQEVRALYDAHASLIGQPFSQVEAALAQQWHDDRVVQLRRALVDRLRVDAQISYQLLPPHLSRQEVSPGPLAARGPADAKVSIVEFGDYSCPYTAQARRLMTRIMALYPQQVVWHWRDFPIDVDSAQHPAAEAAVCAQEQQQFWAYHGLIFERGSPPSTADLHTMAAGLGLNMPAFRDCLASPRPKLTIAQSQRDGRRLGVEATPTLFINGMPIDSVLPLAAMQAFIERELAEH